MDFIIARCERTNVLGVLVEVRLLCQGELFVFLPNSTRRLLLSGHKMAEGYCWLLVT